MINVDHTVEKNAWALKHLPQRADCSSFTGVIFHPIKMEACLGELVHGHLLLLIADLIMI